MKIYFIFAALLIANFANGDASRDAVSDMNFNHMKDPLPRIWGRDPFLKTPGFYPGKVEEPKFLLEAIIFDGKHSTAVVDGVTLSVNSVHRGKRVVKIGPNYVVLGEENSLMELVLPPIPPRRTRLEVKEVDGED